MLDDFLTRALLAGIGLALVTGPAGCFVVWRRLAYFGETIAHSALLGVALAILLEIHLVIGIFASASAIVLVMFFLERRDTLPVDTLLGLLAQVSGVNEKENAAGVGVPEQPVDRGDGGVGLARASGHLNEGAWTVIFEGYFELLDGVDLARS